MPVLPVYHYVILTCYPLVGAVLWSATPTLSTCPGWVMLHAVYCYSLLLLCATRRTGITVCCNALLVHAAIPVYHSTTVMRCCAVPLLWCICICTTGCRSIHQPWVGTHTPGYATPWRAGVTVTRYMLCREITWYVITWLLYVVQRRACSMRYPFFVCAVLRGPRTW